jgi:short-subunit dehydrogenase
MAWMSPNTNRQCIVITGATGVVGSGLARHFDSRGWRVALMARDRGRLDELAASLNGVNAYTADLADAASLERLVARMHADGIVPDALINNAADVTSKPLLETSVDEIEHIVRVNVTGALQLCRLIAPEMIARGSGTIVNISSLAGYKPNPAQTVYGISKGAMNAMSEALRAELGPRGIHVVNVALMGVGTGPGRIPVEEVARRVERAIAKREPEVFFYRRTKWLMRLYAAFPWLARR